MIKKEDRLEVTLLEKNWREIWQEKNIERESVNEESFHRKGLIENLRRFTMTTGCLVMRYMFRGKTMEHQNEEKIHGKRCNAMVKNRPASIYMRSSLWLRSSNVDEI
jgi:hypothetical protein